jgi:predicted GNAT family N-acyltransferase
MLGRPNAFIRYALHTESMLFLLLVYRFMKIKVKSYEESERDIRCIRDSVFGQEQKIPRQLDWDGTDRHCIHVVATDSKGVTVGVGRIAPDGKIGRLAVLKDWRRRGVGAKMLEVLVKYARKQGIENVCLHAQVHALAFYEKSGFEQDGDEFIEAGIRHITMMRCTRATPDCDI